MPNWLLQKNLFIGPKVVGSRANEVLSVDYLLDYLNEIKANASNPDDITIKNQMVSGHHSVFSSAGYVNIQNIVVHLQGEYDHVLMLNCHFDSVPGSPGASDDIVSLPSLKNYW